MASYKEVQDRQQQEAQAQQQQAPQQDAPFTMESAGQLNEANVMKLKEQMKANEFARMRGLGQSAGDSATEAMFRMNAIREAQDAQVFGQQPYGGEDAYRAQKIADQEMLRRGMPLGSEQDPVFNDAMMAERVGLGRAAFEKDVQDRAARDELDRFRLY